MRTNVLEYLEESVARVPDQIAFSDGAQSLTFRELYNQARAVGTALRDNGYHKEPILVCMKKSPQTVAVFFGVVYAGCYYVPLDDETPPYRIQMIAQRINPRAAVCGESLQKLLEGTEIASVYNASDLVKAEPDDELLRRVRDNAIDMDPLYTVFTSGSTGVPKGVVASHRSVLDYVESLSDTLGFDSDTVFGNQAPLSIDACLKELYPTLKVGATTYLIPKSLFMFPLKLTAFLNEHQVNTLCWVASALTMLSAYGALEQDLPRYLRTVAFGGEVFPQKQLEMWLAALPDTRFFNLYGPTEATGMSCYYEVPRDFSMPLPVGRPFRNTEIILLGENGQAVPHGEAGEICIRGAGLTLGYWGDFEKTAEVFTQNPLNQFCADPIYKTGDLGRFNDAGELMFMSRRDHQIKHMGHRIELGEIEAAAGQAEGVRRACCVYDDESHKITLFYVGEIAVSALASQLRSMLPRYMVPGAFIPLESFPLTVSGKLDRKALTERLRDTK